MLNSPTNPLTDPNLVAMLMGTLMSHVDLKQLPKNVVERMLKNPDLLGVHFTNFLLAGGKMNYGKLATLKPERHLAFPFESFNGQEISVVEEDATAVALDEIKLGKVKLVNHMDLGCKEDFMPGAKFIDSVKEKGWVRLDIHVFWMLWNNPTLIPQEWKATTNGQTTFIAFDGSIVKSPKGTEKVMCIYWMAGSWHYQWKLNERERAENTVSAVLKKK